MVGPGRSKTAILGSVATPTSGEFAQRMPIENLRSSAQEDTNITNAMRGPGPRRSTAPVVGGGPGRESQDFQIPDMDMDFGGGEDFGEDFMGELMGGLQHPAGSGMPGAYGMPGPVGMPGGLPGTTSYGGSSGPMVPQEIKGNLPAIKDWRKSGLPFDKWMQTVGASPWF